MLSDCVPAATQLSCWLCRVQAALGAARLSRRSSCFAEATFVAVSPQSGRAEVDDVLAAIRPTTCLVSVMLANNETGVIMVSDGCVHNRVGTRSLKGSWSTDLLPSCQPVTELSQRIRALNVQRVAEGLPRILVHTDAAQMIGKGRVDVQELGVDYLTIVGHKVWPMCRSPTTTSLLRCQGDTGCLPQLDTSSVPKVFPLSGALKTVFSWVTRVMQVRGACLE